MPLIVALAAGALIQVQTPAKAPETPDPNRLPIGRGGTATVKEGQILDLRTNSTASVEDIVKSAEGVRFVYLGESHTNPEHHKMQAAIIEALAKSGRDVVVGFEQFTRPVQDALNPWTLGWWTEEEFIKNADWKGQWGYDFALYRPIFEATKKYKLPMVALNVPRDWVRAVGRGGPDALPSDAKSQVPSLDLTNQDHRSVWSAMMGGHPPMGNNQMENMYAAQVLWDTAMADSALKYLSTHATTSKTVFVVIAGSGHVMYGQAVNYRIWKRTGEKGVTVVMVEAEEEKGMVDRASSNQKAGRPSDPIFVNTIGRPGRMIAKVARGIGDFVFASRPIDEGKGGLGPR